MRTIDLRPAARRGRDPGLFLSTLLDRIWVRCPSCAGPALVARGESVRLSCARCGHDKTWPDGLPAKMAGIDPWRPRCQRCGGDFPRRTGVPATRHGPDLWARRRCPGCGRVMEYQLVRGAFDVTAATDPWFGLPFYLVTEVRGQTLWVANTQQLLFLEDYLGEALRKRSLHPHHRSMMARLPRWMKAAGARSAVRAGLGRLRAEALKAGIA